MLRNLQLAEFIYEQPAFPDPEYTFKHALTQEVAYNSVLTERRKAIHERAARAIESVCADSIEDHLHELAHHYGRSENIAKAVEYLRLASEQAFKRSHYDEARARASAALELLEKLPDRLSRNRSELALRLNLGATAITARGYAAEEAQSAFERAAQLGRDLEAIPETFSAIGGLFGVCLVRAQHRRAFDFANELVELAQKDDSLGIDAHFALGTNLFWRARFADSWKNLEQAFGGYHAGLKLANIVAADTPAFAMAYGAAALWHLGYPQKAHELCGRALERIEEVQHPYTSAAARLNVTNTLLLLRNSVEAQREAAEIVSNATVSGFPYMEGIGRAFQQYAALQRKPDLPTVTELANTLTQLREHGARCGLPQVSVALAEGYCALGEPAQALAVLDNVLNEIEDTSEYQAKAELVRLKGELLKRTNLDEAERNFRIAILIAQEQQAKSWELRATMSLARLLAQQGRRDEAGAMLAEIYHWFTEGFDTPDLKDAKALLDELSS
jgi:tetratricopeptide (TPR) repeat protein